MLDLRTYQLAVAFFLFSPNAQRVTKESGSQGEIIDGLLYV